MSFKDKVILASASPRRRELLGNLFNNIQYIKSKLDEPTWHVGQAPSAYLSHCLEVKWQGALLALKDDALAKLDGRSVLIVADTTVVLKNRLLEKPKNKVHAFEMLKELSGQTHLVATGVRLGLFNGEHNVASTEFTAKSLVSFFKLSDGEIRDYVKTGEPMDKAGAYGFQDRALKFVRRLEGSYLNVVGLPLLEIEREAKAIGVT